MKSDCMQTTICQERKKDPIEMFHSGQLVKVCAPMVRYSKWAMAEGYGACLINKPELVRDMVKQVRNQVETPGFSVSIKIRIHDDLKRTVDLCRKAEATGVSWITVHGRTAEERHQPVHYDSIKIIKENMSIPVIANGDIRSLKEAENVWQITGTDGEEKKMTLQWAAVATFLYAEIGLILIFCLPFIPPQRWQKIFSFNVWGKIATFWNKAFLTIIILLIVLFLDAVREVRKYSSVHTIERSSTSRPDAYEHTQMKLFRSQRNLYISGFSLFFWLVLRRLVTLITQLAKELSNKSVLKTQAENTNKAAKKFMEENEKLKRILKSHGKDEECVLEAENKKLVQDQEKLKTELRKTSDALSKAQNDVMEMKMQSERLSKEYDQLLKEHSELQDRLERGNKKRL
ncbi:B-cell receptor-associated protein 29 isoform X3 [Macaca fascicularis]|uniref:Dihydrouridine synthase 4 like n=1 Tax=Macaca fascicularis TaxID=9541 RepID=A0A7N9CZ82_MACFA